jgi:hypothetical protein
MALKDWFDVKSAILGAILMGTAVGAINSGHGFGPALIAAAKQSAYTFFVAGFIMQLSRWLAMRDQPPAVAISLAVFVPTSLTAVLVFILHSMKGTPEPLWSTVPVVSFGLIAFFLVSRKLVAEKLAASESLIANPP